MNKEEIDIWLNHFANNKIAYKMFDENGKEIKISFYRVLSYMKELQQKVNQLETNRNDAIDFIDIYTDGINLEAFDCLELMYKIKGILERGKECSK